MQSAGIGHNEGRQRLAIRQALAAAER